MKLSRAPQYGDGTAGGKPQSFVPLSLLAAGQRVKPDPDDGPPCHLCTARCCKYFALPIDTPRSRQDFDYVRWYLMHEGIVVWVQDGDWYLEVRTHCRHLQPDNSCGAYETRPNVCREYGSPKEGPCEYFTDDLEYDLFFDSDRKFELWLSKREQERKRRREARKRARSAVA